MSRWDPDARGRLELAALELFAEQGFTATTVPQITERAGLTTRTFFRYFADKREVLFSGEDEVREQFAEIVREAPPSLAAMEFVDHVLTAVATTIFGRRFDEVRRRRSIIAGDEGLRERELRKEQLMAEMVVEALRERGFDGRDADLVARLASLVLQSAVAGWVEQPAEERRLVTFVDEALDHLRSIVTSTASRGGSGAAAEPGEG